MKGKLGLENDVTDIAVCVKVAYADQERVLRREKRVFRHLRRHDSSRPESHKYIVNCLSNTEIEEKEVFAPDNNMYFLTPNGDFMPSTRLLTSTQSILALECGQYTLSEILKERNLSVPQRVHILEEIVEAVRFIHKMGVVHFDLKPENIMCFIYEGKFRWKLIDFDASFILEDTLSRQISPSDIPSLKHTMMYAAPEVLKFIHQQPPSESLEIETNLDIWSLGLLAFHLFTGYHLYEFALINGAVDSPVNSMTLNQDFINKTIGILPEKEKLFLEDCLQVQPANRRPASSLLTKSLFQTGNASQRGATSHLDHNDIIKKITEVQERLSNASTENIVNILNEELVDKFRDFYFAMISISARSDS